MIIYLYKKTHRITGLKYLGKTQKDPFKYSGSGIYWIQHIKKHGNYVDTEILKECVSNDEVKTWGLYYSNLWNIVNAKDDNGNKLWANLVPEEGNGLSIETAKIINNRPETKDKLSNTMKKMWQDENKKVPE